MNIGFYAEPTNENMLMYKGLYRQNGLIDISTSKNRYLNKGIKWYFRSSIEGNFMEYSEENKQRLLLMYEILKTEQWQGEIIIFTDNFDVEIPSNCKFLGYDICADSKYYSPIGDGFLETYDTDSVFFSEMHISDFECYKKNINMRGLFSTISKALEFSNYCNMMNEKYNHAVETEKNWRPFALYGPIR